MKAGTFDTYPSHSADPFIIRRSKPTNQEPIFRPPPGPKSTPVRSIITANVNRFDPCLSHSLSLSHLPFLLWFVRRPKPPCVDKERSKVSSQTDRRVRLLDCFIEVGHGRSSVWTCMNFFFAAMSLQKQAENINAVFNIHHLMMHLDTSHGSWGHWVFQACHH